MAALVCDICGGKLSMGSGGIAVCESCGMEHTKDRMQEKIQEIKGTVRIDNSHMIENYLRLAQIAFDQRARSEVDKYCKKILEIDLEDYRPYYLLGRATFHSYSLGGTYVNGSIEYFLKAIEFARPDIKVTLIENIDEELQLLPHFIQIQLKFFIKEPEDSYTVEYLKNALVDMVTGIEKYCSYTDNSSLKDKILSELAQKLESTVFESWNKAFLPEYAREKQKRGQWKTPIESNYDEFFEDSMIYHSAYSTALLLRTGDAQHDRKIYNNLLDMVKNIIEIGCWYITDEIDDEGYLVDINNSPPQEYLVQLNQLMKAYESEIMKIQLAVEAREAEKIAEREKLEREASESRYNKYWEEHIEDKKALEEKIQNLSKQLKIGREEIERLESDVEQKNLENRIRQLEQERASLGVFKRQEKKSIQERIELTTSQLTSLVEKRATAIQIAKDKLKSQESELNKYQAELMKAR